MIKRDPKQERAANAFAAEFLMPKMALSREAHKYSLKTLALRYMFFSPGDGDKAERAWAGVQGSDVEVFLINASYNTLRF